MRLDFKLITKVFCGFSVIVISSEFHIVGPVIFMDQSENIFYGGTK